MGFLDGSAVKNLPAKQKNWVRSLCWEDPLEKEMATHSSTLAWEVPWTEEPGGIQSLGSQSDPMNHSMPGLPVHHQTPEFIQTHVH